MNTKRSWREKLADDKGFPKVFKLDRAKAKRLGGATMVIPSPAEVDALMKRVPKRRVTTVLEIQRSLASKHGAGIACPFTTGIFAWIAANAADESAREGAKRITPYWRTLKSTGEINPKYPGGAARLAKQLKAEGHAILRRGAKYFVERFNQRLAAL